MENSFTTLSIALINCEATFIKYNWIKYIRQQWMEVVSDKLMYLSPSTPQVKWTFSYFYLDVAERTKSNVRRWNITLASLALAWFIPVKDWSFKPSKAISRPTASPKITRKDDLQVLEMIRIPYHAHS